jgi:hypothetical protein
VLPILTPQASPCCRVVIRAPFSCLSPAAPSSLSAMSRRRLMAGGAQRRLSAGRSCGCSRARRHLVCAASFRLRCIVVGALRRRTRRGKWHKRLLPHATRLSHSAGAFGVGFAVHPHEHLLALSLMISLFVKAFRARLGRAPDVRRGQWLSLKTNLSAISCVLCLCSNGRVAKLPLN